MLNCTKWSKKFDCCVKCGKTDKRHASCGVCISCYRRVDRVTCGWSIHYECCVVCGGTDRKHEGKGLCTTCYGRGRDRNGSARVETLTYTPVNWEQVEKLKNVRSGYLGFLEPETLRRLGYDG